MGPVQSGKTTELLRILNRHRIANRRVVVIAPPERVKAPVTYSVMGVNKLPDLDDLQDYDVIGVDSAETFTGIAEWADSLANSGKLVEVSGLDGDPQGQAFTGMMQLISICEKVQKLDSVCPMTGLPAPFSVLRDGAIIPISRSGLLLQQRLERAIVGRAV
jgi:thymidine kinase